MTQPPAQHARRKPESGWRRGAKVLAIALTVAVVAALAVGGFYAWSLTQRLAEAAVPLKDAPAQPPALSA